MPQILYNSLACLKKYDGNIFLLLDKNSFATSHSKAFSGKPRRNSFLEENSNSIGGIL